MLIDYALRTPRYFIMPPLPADTTATALARAYLPVTRDMPMLSLLRRCYAAAIVTRAIGCRRRRRCCYAVGRGLRVIYSAATPSALLLLYAFAADASPLPPKMRAAFAALCYAIRCDISLLRVCRVMFSLLLLPPFSCLGAIRHAYCHDAAVTLSSVTVSTLLSPNTPLIRYAIC